MNKAKLALLGLVSGAGSAFAAVPTEVSTAVETMATDGATLAAAVLVAIIGIVAIKFLRKGVN